MCWDRSCKCPSSTVEDVGLELTVAVSEGDSLQTACDQHFAPEQMDARCTCCGIGHLGTRQLSVVDLPPVLIIQLRRYMTSSAVLVEETLSTDNWMPAGASRLHLSAVVCHQGGMHGPARHYTAVCWVAELGSWIHANDTQVSLISAANALGQAGRLGYLFFYRQPDTPSWFSVRQFRGWSHWPVMDWVQPRLDQTTMLHYPMVSRTDSEVLPLSEQKAVGEVGLLILSPHSMVSDDVVDTFLRLVAIEMSATHGLVLREPPSCPGGVHFLPTGWLWTQRHGMLGVLQSANYDR
eukprot:3939910-Rhodomonas_salina.1